MSGRIVKEKKHKYSEATLKGIKELKAEMEAESKPKEVWIAYYTEDDDGETRPTTIDKAFDSEKKAINFVKANYAWEDYEGEEITDEKARDNIKKLVVE